LKTTYLIIILVIFSACKNDSKNTETSIDATNTETSSKVYETLQGSWANVQDTLSTITFEGNTSRNLYKGVDTGRSIFFTINSSCATDQSIKTAEEDKYLNTTGAAEECYYIKTLNETTLELTLVAENITLQFTRQ
tara:strand:+ start:43884 stop:44291 length:408 start_codon:yes stop_codon:yes gene_type:complete